MTAAAAQVCQFAGDQTTVLRFAGHFILHRPLATPRQGVRPDISNQHVDATSINVLMVNGMVAAAGGHATSFAADFEVADEAAIAVAQFAQTRHGGPRRGAKRRIHDAVARLERL